MLAAKIAILSHFLRASETRSRIRRFQQGFSARPGPLCPGFALEHWRGLRDKDRFSNWRAVAGKASKNEARDGFLRLARCGARVGIRLNARPFLALLHHKLPFVVSQEHVTWPRRPIPFSASWSG